MRRVAIEYKRGDARGVLVQLSTGNWKQVNILAINPDAVMGGHYHKSRIELFYVVEGAVKINNNELLSGGDAILIEPGDMHSFKGMGKEPAIVVELLSEPYNEKDTWTQ